MSELRRILVPPVRGEVVPHYRELRSEAHALRLGMWIFIGTEMLMFSGLFVAYAYYRTSYPTTFSQAPHYLHVGYGALMTILLVTGSLSLIVAEKASRLDIGRLTVLALAITAALGTTVIGIEFAEWYRHFQRGFGPGRFYTTQELIAPGASLFFSIYYLLSGLHILHLAVGVGLIAWLMWIAARGMERKPRWMALEMTVLYWNMVVIIWLFVYPLFYLE